MVGVRLIAINDHYDSSQEKRNSDAIIVPIKNLMNDAYCRDISVKIKSQLEAKRRRGEYVGNYAVYGYADHSRPRNVLYLPYSKCVYKTAEISQNAERAAKYRDRNSAVQSPHDAVEMKGAVDGALWQCIIAFQNYPFHTSSGLPFTYTLKTGRGGTFTRELFISRRENSKSLTWSGVRLAFTIAVENKGMVIAGSRGSG